MWTDATGYGSSTRLLSSSSFLPGAFFRLSPSFDIYSRGNLADWNWSREPTENGRANGERLLPCRRQPQPPSDCPPYGRFCALSLSLSRGIYLVFRRHYKGRAQCVHCFPCPLFTRGHLDSLPGCMAVMALLFLWRMQFPQTNAFGPVTSYSNAFSPEPLS